MKTKVKPLHTRLASRSVVWKLKLGRGLIIAGILLFLAINGILTILSIKNLAQTNQTITPGEPSVEILIDSPYFSTDLSGNITEIFALLNDSIDSLEPDSFTWDGSSIPLNESFTFDDFIASIELRLLFPMQLNNTGYYPIAPITATFTIGNTTDSLTIYGSTPRIPPRTFLDFHFALSLQFDSLADLNRTITLFDTASVFEIRIQTTFFWFFPLEIRTRMEALP